MMCNVYVLVLYYMSLNATYVCRQNTQLFNFIVSGTNHMYIILTYMHNNIILYMHNIICVVCI